MAVTGRSVEAHSGLHRALQPICSIQLLQSSQVSASHSCSEDGVARAECSVGDLATSATYG